MADRGRTALVFEPIEESHVAMIEEWLRDPESMRRVGGMIPFRPCFEYAQQTPDFYEWIVCDGSVAVGLAGFEIDEDGTAGVVLLIRPDRRGTGYGKRSLEALCSRPELRPGTELAVFVEVDHEVALRCYRAVGFVDAGPDPEDEGFLKLVYRTT